MTDRRDRDRNRQRQDQSDSYEQNDDRDEERDEGCDEPDEPEAPDEPEQPGDKPRCEPLDPGPQPPVLEEPQRCEPCCNCPSEPPRSETCFDKLIEKQADLLSKAELAKAFKAELEDLLKKATAARQAYSRDKYQDFTKRWQKQDEAIVAKIHSVTCNLDCWWCVIECEICPLLYKIREIEHRLDGDGTLIGAVHSLRDLRHWHERNLAAKTARFDRIKAVLTAWNDPAKTIDANLVANEKLIGALQSMEPAEAVLQLFLKLIPMHLAIAPRPINSAIKRKYIDLCEPCDQGEPDDCCGPDVGRLSARQRLVEPQAYIVDPERYFDILCCIATERYLPAKDQMAKAKADLAGVEATIARLEDDLKRRKDSVFEDFRSRIVTPVDCDKYRRKDGDDDGCGGKRRQNDDPTVR